MNKIIYICHDAFEVVGNAYVEGKDGYTIRNIKTDECGFIDAETYIDSQN